MLKMDRTDKFQRVEFQFCIIPAMELRGNTHSLNQSIKQIHQTMATGI